MAHYFRIKNGERGEIESVDYFRECNGPYSEKKFKHCRSSSSDSIETDCELYGRGSIPGRCRMFFFAATVSGMLWSTPSPCPLVLAALSPGEIAT
jgi:hypothetical protein